MNNTDSPISDQEKVVRILNRNWLDGDKLLALAFALRYGETYLSVNRPAIETFNDDIANFVRGHSLYAFDDNNSSCRLASMNVGGVRNVKVELDGKAIDIDVEIEPRDARIKSHAGIFTRYNNRNLKTGDTFIIQKEEIPVDDILLKVRLKLMKIATVERHEIK